MSSTVNEKETKQKEQTELNDDTYYFVIFMYYKDTVLADKLGLPCLCVAKPTFLIMKNIFIKQKSLIDKICGKCEKPIDTVKFLLKEQFPDKFKVMEDNNIVPTFNVRIVNKERYEAVCSEFGFEFEGEKPKKKPSSKKKKKKNLERNA